MLAVPEYEEEHPLDEEDPTVQAIVALRQHDEIGTSVEHLNPDWIAALRDARMIYRSDPQIRFQVEAFVLAGEATAEIGARVGRPASTIAEYERCFFDVRYRLNAIDFILDRVVDGRADLGLLERQLLRHAYLGGIAVAEHWFDHSQFIGRGIKHDLDTVQGQQREQLELILLQASTDFRDAKPRVLVERFRRGKPARRLPTVSDLVREQVERALQQFPKDDEMPWKDVTFLEPFREPGIFRHSAVRKLRL